MNTTKSLLTTLFELEEQLVKLNSKSKVTASVTASNKGEMWDAFHNIKVEGNKLHKPFEVAPHQNYYYFEYQVRGRPHLTITVKSKPQANRI